MIALIVAFANNQVVEKMYVMEINLDIEGDTFFPRFEQDKFVKVVKEKHDGEIPYTYVTYIRK